MGSKQVRLLVCFLIGTVLFAAGCPGKEGTLIKNIVTRFGKPPVISVYMKDSGKKVKMDIDEYLVGVVAGEMKPGWPLNAYAAQAIIARTFTMEFLSRGGTRALHGTDISTDEKEAQAYNAKNITPTIRKAVQMTKGLVLTYNNRYIKGWYSASSGGVTALAKEGLAYKEAEPPYVQSVKSPEEKVIPKSELLWQATFTSDEINQALKKLNQGEVGMVRRFEVVKRGHYRAVGIRIVGDKGTAQVHGADLRINIGPEKMRSIWLTDISTTGGKVTLKGRGFGHGVGLSQWGAHALARENKSPEDIVKHFYPKAHVDKIW
ncbi:stage II sporulation protein D [Hydrogenispora ethanolica]|uniref:Stage II sporulation protein D n=1 Tax=Hydrogenispora ethanolica TaxID=1082276 RepID=A0A4R1S259_HYDET|nr:SpoIID/LytB domain-containing protein [Hydrogenispora ethanolica]TCL73258.1 stage II sporulation protein D [Hydrogenispora ethanolica]